ncbi:hypothetical protein ACFE04_016065 [Oxalis oulophora]
MPMFYLFKHIPLSITTSSGLLDDFHKFIEEIVRYFRSDMIILTSCSCSWKRLTSVITEFIAKLITMPWVSALFNLSAYDHNAICLGHSLPSVLDYVRKYVHSDPYTFEDDASTSFNQCRSYISFGNLTRKNSSPVISTYLDDPHVDPAVEAAMQATREELQK